MITSTVNANLWENYELFARARGRLVAHILSHEVKLTGAHILDFGCGTGGISIELTKAGAHVDALDTSKKKLSVLRQAIDKECFHITILHQLPDENSVYDAVILLDVIEHLLNPGHVLKSLATRLKPNGVMYLSTPNKVSPFNILVDPHFSLPFVSLLRRKQVKRLLADWLKWQPHTRIDFPELMTLEKVDRVLTTSGFQWRFVNSQVLNYAFENPESVWNRNAHLKIITALKKMGAISFLARQNLNDIDFFNIWLNPTWYIVAQKKPDSSN